MGKRIELLEGSKRPKDLLGSVRYKQEFRAQHPNYFDPEGLLIFCGGQGTGKSISAVQYCQKILQKYPKCKFVSNIKIKDLPEEVEVIEYDGLDTLFNVSNGYEGVLYLIDEIHFEFCSLESKNMSIEELIEFAQQRKQRKHIVGTSQVFMRVAKPLREQVKNIVLCENYFDLIQHNKLIDGTTAYEENGKLHCDVIANYWWFHSAELYDSYDTYAKMKRYKKEWKGRKYAPQSLPYSGLTLDDINAMRDSRRNK